MNGTLEVGDRQAELVAAILLVLLSCWILWSALHMPLGTGAAPGPGTVPAALGTLLLATSVGLVIRAIRLSGATAVKRIALGHSHIWLVLSALVAVAILFERLGYIITMVLFMTVLLRRLSSHGWAWAAASAVTITLGTYYFFNQLLGVTLPPGLLRLS